MTARDSLKGFWYLIATQFQGAFSDNAYKNIVTLVAVSTAVTPQQESQRISLAGTIFILPFLLFSMYGGFLRPF
jgi:acyl-[acyl-carrier-protein]-phospholipid O-acyltransferase/long-chain-fatty-acid--[acyl-carrier-protein] ligase